MTAYELIHDRVETLTALARQAEREGNLNLAGHFHHAANRLVPGLVRLAQAKRCGACGAWRKP